MQIDTNSITVYFVLLYLLLQKKVNLPLSKILFALFESKFLEIRVIEILCLGLRYVRIMKK